MSNQSILKYKVFETSKAFAGWQQEGLRKIQTVTPMAGSVVGDCGDASFSGEITVNVFVTYWEPSEEDE